MQSKDLVRPQKSKHKDTISILVLIIAQRILRTMFDASGC